MVRAANAGERVYSGAKNQCECSTCSCGRPPGARRFFFAREGNKSYAPVGRRAGGNPAGHLEGAPLGAPMSFWMYCTVETLCGITTVLPNSTTPSAVGTETIVRMPALAACRNL